jgi:hypothetical protein
MPDKLHGSVCRDAAVASRECTGKMWGGTTKTWRYVEDDAKEDERGERKDDMARTRDTRAVDRMSPFGSRFDLRYYHSIQFKNCGLDALDELRARRLGFRPFGYFGSRVRPG